MLNRLKGLWKRIRKRLFPKKDNNVMAEYDGRHCRVYLTNGARLVGTIRILDNPTWVKIEGQNKCSKLRISQISSVVVVL